MADAVTYRPRMPQRQPNKQRRVSWLPEGLFDRRKDAMRWIVVAMRPDVLKEKENTE